MKTRPENRPRINFDAAKLADNKRPYADTIREALCYLLEHEMPEELVAVCEGHGWIVDGEWNFSGICKTDLGRLYCTIKNILWNDETTRTL